MAVALQQQKQACMCKVRRKERGTQMCMAAEQQQEGEVSAVQNKGSKAGLCNAPQWQGWAEGCNP